MSAIFLLLFLTLIEYVLFIRTRTGNSDTVHYNIRNITLIGTRLD